MVSTPLKNISQLVPIYGKMFQTTNQYKYLEPVPKHSSSASPPSNPRLWFLHTLQRIFWSILVQEMAAIRHETDGWLVVLIWKIWKSMGRMTSMMENKKCLKRHETTNQLTLSKKSDLPSNCGFDAPKDVVRENASEEHLEHLLFGVPGVRQRA